MLLLIAVTVAVAAHALTLGVLSVASVRFEPEVVRLLTSAPYNFSLTATVGATADLILSKNPMPLSFAPATAVNHLHGELSLTHKDTLGRLLALAPGGLDSRWFPLTFLIDTAAGCRAWHAYLGNGTLAPSPSSAPRRPGDVISPLVQFGGAAPEEERLARRWFLKPGGFHGHNADAIHVLTHPQAARHRCPTDGPPMLAQQQIATSANFDDEPGAKTDYRFFLLVLGGTGELYVHPGFGRRAGGDAPLVTNRGTAHLVTHPTHLDDQLDELARALWSAVRSRIPLTAGSRAFGLYGVDYVVDHSTGRVLLLEVNGGPAQGIGHGEDAAIRGNVVNSIWSGIVRLLFAIDDGRPSAWRPVSIQ
jgi:hypothetical protein